MSKQKQINQFNERCPVGTEVIVMLDDGRDVYDKVKHEATIMGGHTPVAWLHGHGAYRLDRVRKAPPVPQPQGVSP